MLPLLSIVIDRCKSKSNINPVTPLTGTATGTRMLLDASLTASRRVFPALQSTSCVSAEPLSSRYRATSVAGPDKESLLLPLKIPCRQRGTLMSPPVADPRRPLFERRPPRSHRLYSNLDLSLSHKPNCARRIVRRRALCKKWPGPRFDSCSADERNAQKN